MSEVKVNKISPRTNCGTVTLGDSGDTFTIPSGATITNAGTATGFGRTGTVDWDTTPKTGTVTAATGKGYFVNTTAGEITVNLPAGAAGSIVAVSDYASTANTNNILVEANGAELINADAGTYTISTAGLAVTLVYVDGTRGWKSVTGSDADATGVTASYIAATGGTPCAGLTCGNYKTHVFTGPGTLCVSAVGNCAGSNTVEHLTVAGGGGAGKGSGSAGGGAGGFRTTYPSPVSGGTPVSVQPYPITVGGGGAGATTVPARGVSGSTSTFSTIDSAGGGGGGSGAEAVKPGADGGSGGGGAFIPGNAGGAGDTPPTPVAQGFPGGTGAGCYAGGGGGGATVAGSNAPVCQGKGGTGGPIADAYFGPTAPSYGTPGPVGSTRYFAGGGGGGRQTPATPPGGAGGAGGGGAGEHGPPDSPGVSGTCNTGGGGGGSGGPSGNGGAGGSGVVMVRYKFQ